MINILNGDIFNSLEMVERLMNGIKKEVLWLKKLLDRLKTKYPSNNHRLDNWATAVRRTLRTDFFASRYTLSHIICF